MHIHDNAWATIATLTAVVVCQPLLYGMEPGPLPTDTLCSSDGPTIAAQHGAQALKSPTTGLGFIH